jgi:hypothetical protein
MLLRLVPFLSFLAPALAADIPLGNYFVQYLGPVTDANFNSNGVYHDGGGGAFQNGYHVQVFADSTTNLDGVGMVHNSIAYSGYVCPIQSLTVF